MNSLTSPSTSSAGNAGNRAPLIASHIRIAFLLNLIFSMGLCLLLAACASPGQAPPGVLLRPTALVSLAPVGWQVPTATPRPTAVTPSAIPRAVVGWGEVKQLVWTGEDTLLLRANSGLFTYDTKTLALLRVDPAPFDAGLWPVAQPALPRSIPTGPVDLWVFSPDGRWIAVGSWGEIQLWDHATLHLVGKLQTSLKRPFATLSFSPDSATLASLGVDGDLWLWDVAQQALRGTAYVRGWSPGMCYSSDGTVLVTWGDQIDFREPQTGVLQTHLTTPHSFVADATFSPDGKTLAVLGEDKIAFWDVVTSEWRSYELHDHVSSVYQVACSPDGQRLLTIDDDGLVQVRDPMTLHVMGDWHGDWRTVYATDSTVTYLAGWDRYEKVLSVHHAVDGRVVFTTTTSWPTAIAFAETEQLATADNIGHIRLWDIATGKIVTTLTQGRVSVTHLAFAPDGHRLAASDAAGRIVLYRIRTDHAYTTLHNSPFITATLDVPLTHTVALAFAPDGNTVAALFSQAQLSLQVVRLWDAETGELYREWVVPDRDARDLVWNLEGSRLAVSTAKGVYVWDPRDGREIVRLPRGGEEYAGGQMAFCARDDWQMLAVSHGSWVGLWDIP